MILPNELTVLEDQPAYVEPNGKKRRRVKCLCVCGKEFVVRYDAIKNGRTKSCGCLAKKLMATQKYKRTHGQSSSRTYRIWGGVVQRCTNKNAVTWPYYGARGITIDQRWLVFENFLQDMGEAPAKLTLERRKNDGNYEKDNCYWATRKEQAQNRRSSIMITRNERTQCLKAWCEELLVDYDAVGHRMRRGMTFEEAIRF